MQEVSDSDPRRRLASCGRWNFRPRQKKREEPPVLAGGSSKDPGDDLLSPLRDYHGPRMLNGRVREGNGWCHPGMLTEKLLGNINRQRGEGSRGVDRYELRG